MKGKVNNFALFWYFSKLTIALAHNNYALAVN